MSVRIYKYPLKLSDHQVVSTIPGRVLTAQMQDDLLCVWILGETAHPGIPAVRRLFRIAGTGSECPDVANMEFVATVQMPPGLVWHVFWSWAGLVSSVEELERYNATLKEQSR